MKNKLRLMGRAFLAAVTSPEAVKQERSLAAFIVVRVALAIGASAAFVSFIEKLIGG